MGNTKSRITGEERKKRDEIKNQAILHRKSEIENVQNNILTNKNNTSIISSETLKILQVTEVAKDQLDRGGAPLTKTDLIAILRILDPDLSNKTSLLLTLTISDMNSMIRNIIYDPKQLLHSISKVKKIQYEENQLKIK
jgi:hypothetical protein